MHPGRTAADNRVFVEAVLWILRTGAPWRDLPDAFGHWHSGYRRFARWQVGGV
jgi:transposase